MALHTFSEIRGHRSQIAALQRLCSAGRHGHAYLFEGPEGVGKDTVAQAFLQRLACLEATPDSVDPCGRCRSCVAAGRGEHPDLTRLKRDGAKIKIEQVRAMQQRLRYEPVLGRIKGVILEDAELLGEEAANALLKTLEEPWPGVVFVLVTGKPQLLLETIRSRCQVLRFAELSPADLTALLVLEGQAPETAAIAALLAEGSMREARVLCDPARMALVDFVVQFALALGAQPASDAAGFVDQLAARLVAAKALQQEKAKTDDDGEAKTSDAKTAEPKSGGRVEFTRVDLQWVLDVLRALLRDALLVAAGIDLASLPHARYGAGLHALLARADTERLVAILDACERLEVRMVLNPNPRLALAALLVEAGGRLRPGTS